MNCKYSYEDITKLLENELSDEYKKDLQKHLKNCNKCRCYYESLDLANRFVLDEMSLEKGSLNSIMSKIDKNRYLNKNYLIKQFIFRRISLIKYSSAVFAFFVIVLVLVINFPKIEKYKGLDTVNPNHENTIINTPIVNNHEIIVIDKVFDSISEDINGDNKEDLVEIVYTNGNLVLKVFNEAHLLDENGDYEFDILQLPKLQTIKDKNGNKYILVTAMNFTNKIGSTVKGWLYDAKNNIVQYVIDITEDKCIAYEAIPLLDGNVKLVLPEIKLDGIFKITDEYKNYDYEKNGIIELSSHIDYFVNDYNSDGCDEIITSRKVFMGAGNWFPIYYIYTVYNVIDGSFYPITYFYDDNDTKRAILKSVFEYGSIKVENKRINNVLPGYEYLHERKDSIDAIKELVTDEVLINDNNNFYLNIK